MKIVAISDHHGKDIVGRIPPCDVLCIIGDIFPMNIPHDEASQRGWFRKRFVPQLIFLLKKVGKIILVAGNHCAYFYYLHQRNRDAEIKNDLPNNVYYLCNDSIVIDGVKFYGNPWVVAPVWAEVGPPVWNFASHNYNFLEAIFKDIPQDADIILSHGPAFGYCDQILDNGVVEAARLKYADSLKAEHLGDIALWDRVKQIADLSNKPQWCLSGHLHSADHNPQKYKDMSFVCVSILNEQYMLGDYKPFELEI